MTEVASPNPYFRAHGDISLYDTFTRIVMNVTVCMSIFDNRKSFLILFLIGIFSGSSTIVLGIGGGDENGGVRVQVHAGDVIVLPAGTAHSMTDSSSDYRYIGVYPDVRLSKQVFGSR
jgi:hypothetical protein